MRSLLRKHPSFALFVALLPGLLSTAWGAVGAGLAIELALAGVLWRAGRGAHAGALTAMACLLIWRAATAREDRLAEIAAWRAERAGPLAVSGRAEAVGPAGSGRSRVLFRVSGTGRSGSARVPRKGWVRLYVEHDESGAGPGSGARPGVPPLGRAVVVQGRFRPAAAAENPGSLDWGGLPGGPRVRGSLWVERWANLAERGPPPVQRLREALSGRIAELFPPLSGGFMQAALFGDREALSPRLREVFTRTGTGHIIAISGMNVAILAGIGWAALSPLVASTRLRRVILAAGLLLYVPLGGSSPSVGRAALMAVVLLAAQASARRVLLLNALGAAGLALLLLQPEALLDPSFQLSFGAVLGLSMLPELPGRRLLGIGGHAGPSPPAHPLAAPEAPRSGSGPPREGGARRGGWRPARELAAGAVDLCVATAVSLAATLPLTLAYFRHFPVVSFAANLLVVPALGALTAGGFAALLGSLVLPGLGRLYARACDLLLLFVFRALEACARPDWAWLGVPGSRVELAGGALIVAALATLAMRWRSARLPAALAAAVAVVIAFAGGRGVSSPRPLELAMLSVGQGDALVLALPGGETLLVDGGPGDAAEAIVAFLHERGVRRLERVFFTHPDADHTGGLAGVLARVPADTVHDGGQWGAGAPYRELLEASHAAGAGYRALTAGERLRFGPVTIDVLWPAAAAGARDPYWDGIRTNDASLVLLVGYRDLRVLLTGDVGAEVERQLAAAYGDSLRADVLKVAHHGSRSSSAPELLDRIGACVALISAGRDNRFGHPHSEVLSRLGSRTTIRRTDLEGALLLGSDGRHYEVRGWSSGTVQRQRAGAGRADGAGCGERAD
ncbi:MAG: ComEC/Rec2 family competence protein [Gemmatimonadota bacterium]